MEHVLPPSTSADHCSSLQRLTEALRVRCSVSNDCTFSISILLRRVQSRHIFSWGKHRVTYQNCYSENSYVECSVLKFKLLSRDRVLRTRTDVTNTHIRLSQDFVLPIFFNTFTARYVERKLNYPVNLQPKNQFVRIHLSRHRMLCACRGERWEVFKGAGGQLKQLVSVWTHSVQEHIRQCTAVQHHMSKCQIYLTANSFLWSGTEYMKRISLLQCVWQRSLVFSIVKHVPDDHPCVNPDSEQS